MAMAVKIFSTMCLALTALAFTYGLKSMNTSTERTVCCAIVLAQVTGIITIWCG